MLAGTCILGIYSSEQAEGAVPARAFDCKTVLGCCYVSTAGANLRVRENPKTGPFVEGLTVHTVQSGEEILRLMEAGSAARTTAATNMNDTSSRSHALFTITFTQASFVAGVPAEKTSKLNLVDLAGSERASSTGATGKHLKEGSSINKSLTTLGIVIEQLAKRTGKGAAFIPYRDSVLTWLLRESLGGNSKTIMLAAISTADVNYGETLSTLHYANRAKNIVNKPIVNEDENVRIIRELRKEVEALKSMIGSGANVSGELKAQIEQSEQLMSALTDSWSQKWSVTTKMMEERELKLEEDGVSVRMESERPHLVSLNMDALATGVTLHYLKDGATSLGGKSRDVQLVGAEVADLHCTLECEDEMVTHLLPQDGKCLVDHQVVVTKTALTQGATLILGAENVFRFNHPRQAREMRAKRSRGELDSSRMSTPFSLMSRASPDLAHTTDLNGSTRDDEELPDFSSEQENAETLQFKLLELQADQEEQRKRSEEESAAKDKKLAELAAALELEKQQKIKLELVRAKVVSEQEALLLPNRSPLRGRMRERAGSFKARSMLARGSSLVHMPDVNFDGTGRMLPGLETLPAEVLANCLLSLLDIATLQQLRQCNKQMHKLVDSLLPLKTAWLGWDALMADFDFPTWEFRLLHFRDRQMPKDTKAKAFKSCCGFGQTHIASLFITTHGVTADDVLEDDAAPFRVACKNGHKEMAEWLKDEYEITKDVAMARDNYALGEACHYGHVEVARWLQETFKLDISDVRADGNYALRMASAHGHFDVLEWMLSSSAFTLTAKDVRTDDSSTCSSFRAHDLVLGGVRFFLVFGD